MPANRTKPRSPLFETAAEEVFRRYGSRWKPRTAKVNRAYLRSRLLPWFRDLPVGEIDRREVERWFAALRETPAAANRSLPILSVILRQAELYGYRPEDSNPCVRLRRFRERGRSRFLSEAEFRQLGRALEVHEDSAPLPIALIRLLALTGCRQGELRTLKWSEYREGNLYLRDSKVGPRTVWLSSSARSLLDSLPRTSDWAFPAPSGNDAMPNESLYRVWRVVRVAAGLPDLRLHDLRHSFASLALRRGETLLTIGRLLGHLDPTTTLRYAHVADPMIRDAAEAVGAALDPHP